MAIPQTFDEAFERAKQLVSIFNENEGKYLLALGIQRPRLVSSLSTSFG